MWRTRTFKILKRMVVRCWCGGGCWQVVTWRNFHTHPLRDVPKQKIFLNIALATRPLPSRSFHQSTRTSALLHWPQYRNALPFDCRPWQWK